MSTLLRADGIEVGYGALTAVRDVSLEVREGETVALIGANGAGKTTTLRAVAGLLPLRRGRIEFEGQRLDGQSSSQIVARGLAHVPEGRQLFPTLTGRGNLELGGRAGGARGGGGGRERPAPGWPPRSNRSSISSPVSGSGPLSSRGPCRAASSRCARSAGASLRGPPSRILS